MKAKDVALLGFVSAAQDYVDKHINDDTYLGDLANIDIKKLKEELLNQLKFFNGSNGEIESLLRAGEDAFNDYKEEKLVKRRINIVNLLGNTFEVEEDNIKVTIDDVKKEFNIIKESKEKLNDEEKIDNKSNDKLIDAARIDVNNLTKANEINAISIEEPKINQDDEILDNLEAGESINTQDFGISDDDELYKAISFAASKTDEELATLNKVPESINDVYADVVNNEKAFEKNSKKQKKENKEPTLSEVLKGYGKQETSSSNEEQPNVRIVEPTKKSENVGTLSESLKNISNEDINTAQNTVQEVAKEIDPLANSNPINPEVPQYLQFIENPGVDAVDDKFYEQKEKEFEEKQIKQQQELKESIENDYALEALEALNDFVDKKERKIEEKKPVEVVDNKPIYDNIASIFPYLSYDFIQDVYANREEIANSYKEGEDVILLHRCIFKDIDNLHEFVEITMAHDYQVNVDEKKMIVDVLKQFENEEGAILSNIYTIANQAKVLNGEYEGYRVIVSS